MKWLNKIVGYLIVENCIEEDDRELYLYGLQLMALIVINIISSVIAGIFLGLLPYIFGILFFFIPLRSFSGGYHAGSVWACTILSQIILIIAAYISKTAAGYEAGCLPFLIPCFLFGILQILRKAPVESYNKLLEKNEKKQYRKIAIIIAAAELLVAFFCILFRQYGAFAIIACVYLTQGILLTGTRRKGYGDEILSNTEEAV